MGGLIPPWHTSHSALTPYVRFGVRCALGMLGTAVTVLVLLRHVERLGEETEAVAEGTDQSAAESNATEDEDSQNKLS